MALWEELMQFGMKEYSAEQEARRAVVYANPVPATIQRTEDGAVSAGGKLVGGTIAGAPTWVWLVGGAVALVVVVMAVRS